MGLEQTHAHRVAVAAVDEELVPENALGAEAAALIDAGCALVVLVHMQVELHQGKGYAKRATRIAIDYAFKVLNIHKLYLHVDKDNKRAAGIYVDLHQLDHARGLATLRRDDEAPLGLIVDVALVELRQFRLEREDLLFVHQLNNNDSIMRYWFEEAYESFAELAQLYERNIHNP
jgi:RimJ/RimL family protein N-acetyltransferase